jgi:ubiquinone biosynthesis protein
VTGPVSPLAERVAGSAWAAAEPGLARAVTLWECEIDQQRASVDAHAARLARPGPLPLDRAARHYAALQLAQAGWALRQLPRDLADGLRPVRDPRGWAKDSVARVIRDQLALLGPSAAEVARIIDESEGLAPGPLVQEVRRRPVVAPAIAGATVRGIVQRVFGHAVDSVDEMPLTHTPISQLHGAVLPDGRRVMVRVRRPGVDRALHGDARITGTLAGTLEMLVPALRGPHPLGFVELATRQMLEEGDLRNEALNTVELGVAVEELGISGIEIPRPVPGMAAERAVVLERIDGRPFAEAADELDPEKAAVALVGITVEAALACGVFHADLRPEHLAVLPDGRLALWGCGTLGCFDRETRRGALRYLMAVLAGDFEGQVEAMRLSGAVPPGVDVGALVADLAATPALQPMTMLAGGQQSALSGLREAVVLLLKHRLRPPIEVVLFVRNLFALRSLLARMSPDADLMTALLPLVQRLPELAQQLDA